VLPVLAEKIPFLMLSAGMAFITIRLTSHAGFLVPYSIFPFSQRLVVSGNAVFEYCRLLFFPFGILPFYLIPDPIPVAFIIKTAVCIIAVVFSIHVRSSFPWLAATLLLFVLPLLPVLAFIQNGDQALAARFTYLPSVGLSIGAALLLTTSFSSRRKVRWKSALGGAALFALVSLYAAISVRDIAVWQDSENYWTRIIDVRPEVASYKERGKLYAERGNFQAAVDDFTAALGMATGIWQRSAYNLYAYRGNAFRSMGRFDEAVQDFSVAISLYPHPLYYYYRGITWKQLGNTAAAEEDLAKAGGASGPLDWFERAGR
jgi:hypothetical protein